jgi:hypothetical protein
MDGEPVAEACVIAQVRDGMFIATAGYLSDALSLASTGRIPEQAPAVPQPAPQSTA